MKIEKLIIYGYGHLKNVNLELGSLLHVFYGKNEAGKSTILSFIETILFGFPRRQPSELQYEPKSGGIHGGKLIASIQSHGQLTIERIRNREPEESMILLNNVKLTEAELQKLLQRVDRSLYRQLFSTRLDHLREMESLNETDLNRFLLGTSLSGNLSLHQIETELEAKQNDLFRPRGRKQIINEGLAELKVMADDVKKSSGLKAEYERIADEKTELETELSNLQKEKVNCRNERQFYEKVQAVQPIFEKIHLQKLKLHDLPQINQFPEDGVARLERLKTRIVDFEAELQTIERRKETLKQAMPSVNEHWLTKADEIDSLRERSEVYRMKQEQLLRVDEQIQRGEEDVRRFIEELGQNWTKPKIIEADVSVAEQEKVEQLANDVIELSNQCKDVGKEMESVRNRLKLTEGKEVELKQKLLSDEEISELQHFVETNDHNQSEHEKAFIEKMIEEYERQLTQVQKNSPILLFSALLIGLIVVTGLFFFNGQVPSAILVIGVGLFSAFFFYKSERDKRLRRDELLQLKTEQSNRLAHLLNTQSDSDRSEIEAAKLKLHTDEENRKQWFAVKHTVEQLQLEFDQLAHQYEKVENLLKTKMEKAEQWAKQHDYPLNVSISHWPQLFHRLKEAKQHVRAIEKANTEKAQLTEWLDKYEQEVYELCSLFQMNHEESVTSLLLKLSRLLEEEKAKKVKLDDTVTQLEEQDKQYEEILVKKGQYVKEKRELLQAANCDTENAFLAAGKAWDEIVLIKNDIQTLERQIQLHIRDEEERKQIEAVLENESFDVQSILSELTDRLRDLDEKEKVLLKRIAELQVEMDTIEAGGEYDVNLQKLELKKAQLRHHAIEWATYAVALHLLAKTKDKFRNERLPKVIEIATRYFSMMTNGAYRLISIPVDGDEFFVESSQSVRYAPQELSRGTQEQLFLSLRFALTATYPSAIRFPILLDDILVHFDHERRQAAFSVIQEHAKSHQILFFTCHEQIANECNGETIVLEQQSVLF